MFFLYVNCTNCVWHHWPMEGHITVRVEPQYGYSKVIVLSSLVGRSKVSRGDGDSVFWRRRPWHGTANGREEKRASGPWFRIHRGDAHRTNVTHRPTRVRAPIYSKYWHCVTEVLIRLPAHFKSISMAVLLLLNFNVQCCQVTQQLAVKLLASSVVC